MRVTLDDFEIANGYDRTLSILNQDSLTMQQQTQQTGPMRGGWIKAFPERATRSIPLNYAVTFPPCDTLEAAMIQSRSVPVLCPKGGVLIEQHEGELVTYSNAWVDSIRVERIGVTNRFTFDLTAVNPSTATPSPLALMNSAYIVNLSTITGLTGGTAGKLDNEITADVAVGFCIFITPTLAGVAQPKMMRLVTDPDPGVTAGNDDPAAGTLTVLPLDYDATTNAKIWIEVL